MAEVTLVIANENMLLEIERPEIAIKRRLFRDGESEYYLNGTPVRLKEIRELFFDTGVGKSAYSVMEQGVSIRFSPTVRKNDAISLKKPPV